MRRTAPRIHGSARRQVQAMFEEERPLLQPLPVQGMQYFTESQRTVCDDTCVRVDHSSYRHVKALTEKLVADALAAIDRADEPRQQELALTQEHPLIRPADIYAELFTRCASAQPSEPSTPGGTTHDHQ